MSKPPDPNGSSPPPPPPPSRVGGGSHVFQAPTGTRDFYPADLNRLRFIQDAWRRTSINHGFEEIDGPTFEHLELYEKKSGEGIVSELFSFERFGGEKKFALRPEFTPTLARLYASKAASLPKPTKWFWTQNCFRAERPQRGRLREFYQWNCDIIGDDSAAADAECIACCVALLESLGLTPEHVRVRINHRITIDAIGAARDWTRERIDGWLQLLDQRSKLDRPAYLIQAAKLGLSAHDVEELERDLAIAPDGSTDEPSRLRAPFRRQVEVFANNMHSALQATVGPALESLAAAITALGVADWCLLDPGVARGLAYYTGMVFEVHEASGAERAIAGGGRYDKLIEMFGGPPTPAVGFGMGDVVLSLVLADKGLMPPDEKIAEMLGLRPDALVISNGTPEADGAVAKVVADLRRSGLHARRSYKTTKNIGKLIQDAAKMRARYCVILESATAAQVKNMETQGQEACPVGDIAARLSR